MAGVVGTPSQGLVQFALFATALAATFALFGVLDDTVAKIKVVLPSWAAPFVPPISVAVVLCALVLPPLLVLP